ncbi:MAG: M3 family oligoendopeptidase [Bacteroidetes bacterium]|nr:M3 family oligoendopeptidase [Bacteroidota bacterium]
MEKTPFVSGAEDIHWDLDDLYRDVDDLRTDLTSCAQLAEDFAKSYRTKVAGLEALDLAIAMNRLGEIQDKAGRSTTYAFLDWSTDTADPERGALLQEVRERYTQISSNLIFFELEWVALEEAAANHLLEAAELNYFRHFLEVQRAQRKHLLSEPEEKILIEKAVTGRAAWNRFFDESLSDARYDYEGDLLTQQEILSKLHGADRAERKKAAEAFTAGLTERARPLAFIFNTILADKATDDRLRAYPTWISSRNLSNEVDDETVASLVEAVTSGYGIVEKYYGIKKRMLGYDDLYDYDRYAPMGESDTRVTWAKSTEIVTEAYAEFHPKMGEIVKLFFSENWIDAALAPNKRGGAFSHGAVPSTHPYILMNYTGRVRDVQTLAHELGHGVHQYLSRDQGIFHADTPLTTAETASVFGEMLTFQSLIKKEEDPRNRLAMVMGKIDDTFATVFRQISMYRFEDRIHAERRETGELSVDRFSEVWLETQQAMFGESVELTDNYKIWWSYIPHFLHTPGYVYAYAFGELLVLALYQRYQEIGESFADQYLELLSAGGSDWPHVLLSRMDIDLRDKNFWSAGVQMIAGLVDEAEQLSTLVK